MGKKIVDLEPETPFHTFTVEQTAQHHSTSIAEGLSSSEAAARLKKYGANELQGEGGVKWYKVLWRQVANALVFILLIATVSYLNFPLNNNQLWNRSVMDLDICLGGV